MKCFMHFEEEAIAVCKKCGKAMCAKCSAYSGHSGICPECRREEFIQERAMREGIVSDRKRDMAWNIFYAIILCWTVIGLFVNIYRYYKNKEEKLENEERINVLTGEINKLTAALNNKGEQFV